MGTGETRAGLPILGFPDRASLEAWLEAEGGSSPGIWLKLAKQGSGRPSVSRAEAIDAALCFGWIDGQLDKYDEDHWLIRFTPRRPRSKWSERNRKRAGALLAEGRVRPPGLAEIEAAKADGRWDAAYDSPRNATVPGDFAKALAKNARARKFFATLRGANRFAVLYRVQDATRPEVRARRIKALVEMLAAEKKFHPSS